MDRMGKWLLDYLGEKISPSNPLPTYHPSGYAADVLPKEGSAPVTGSIVAATDSVIAPMGGYNGASIYFGGTFTGFGASFKASYDGGTTWVNTLALNNSGGGQTTSVVSLAIPSAYRAYLPGATHIGVFGSTLTTGPVSVRIKPHMMAADPVVANAALPALVASTALIGDVGAQVRATSGGITTVGRSLSSLATTNPNNVKPAAGRLYKIRGYNALAGVIYLKLYNKASAPTVGTDIPAATIPLAPSSHFDVDFGLLGEYFSTGISFALTTGSPDSDTGAIAAGNIVGLNLFYA